MRETAFSPMLEGAVICFHSASCILSLNSFPRVFQSPRTSGHQAKNKLWSHFWTHYLLRCCCSSYFDKTHNPSQKNVLPSIMPLVSSASLWPALSLGSSFWNSPFKKVIILERSKRNLALFPLLSLSFLLLFLSFFLFLAAAKLSLFCWSLIEDWTCHRFLGSLTATWTRMSVTALCEEHGGEETQRFTIHPRTALQKWQVLEKKGWQGSENLKGKLSKYIRRVRNESERWRESWFSLQFSPSLVFMSVMSEGNSIMCFIFLTQHTPRWCCYLRVQWLALSVPCIAMDIPFNKAS